MKYPPEHYPNSGIQHTRAIIAIGMAQLCLDCFIPEARHMKERLGRIGKWIDACAEQTQKRRLSAGAKRAVNAWAEVMNEHAIKEHMSEQERDARWAALVWCAWIFCWDVRCTCPEYRSGPKKKAWRYLCDCLERLGEYERRRFPDADEVGTMIYEAGFDALEAA